jgi:hypothetical protein
MQATYTALLAALQQHYGSSNTRSHQLYIDLAGHTIEWQMGEPMADINIRPPGMEICNGGLRLPIGSSIIVQPHAILNMKRVQLLGPGDHESALVNVQGSKAVWLQSCTVTVEPDGFRGRDMCDAVRVSKGGSADLSDCTLSARGADRSCGLRVEGTGSTARANRCTATRCTRAGFSAEAGGQLKLWQCKADECGDGFLATCGGYLVAVNHCISLDSGCAPSHRHVGSGDGFSASGGGQVVVDHTCDAQGSCGAGFHGTQSPDVVTYVLRRLPIWAIRLALVVLAVVRWLAAAWEKWMETLAA